jgi:hypothetical protein
MAFPAVETKKVRYERECAALDDSIHPKQKHRKALAIAFKDEINDCNNTKIQALTNYNVHILKIFDKSKTSDLARLDADIKLFEDASKKKVADRNKVAADLKKVKADLKKARDEKTKQDKQEQLNSSAELTNKINSASALKRQATQEDLQTPKVAKKSKKPNQSRLEMLEAEPKADTDHKGKVEGMPATLKESLEEQRASRFSLSQERLIEARKSGKRSAPDRTMIVGTNQSYIDED